ncbi:MAG: nucleotidyltransferase domain-containing protein [Campylobacterota bacterium]|nr:nucleotidyltransferase domain-containing protein [Campylobacterota bacterium]
MLNKIIDNISTNENILFAYLFGSYATNQQTKDSDVDIAIYLSTYSLDLELQINYELSKLLNKDLDIVILNRVKNIFLLENILKDGVLLKDSEERVDFELVKEHDILDYKAYRRYIDAA